MNPRIRPDLWFLAQLTWLRGVLARKEGQGMVEYALILALIAVVAIIILTKMGHQVTNTFNNVSNSLSSQ
jgi:pilus assembly protein Flp/PilA